MIMAILIAANYYKIIVNVTLNVTNYTDCNFWPAIHLAFFSALFGAQIWMTFVSGRVSSTTVSQLLHLIIHVKFYFKQLL